MKLFCLAVCYKGDTVKLLSVAHSLESFGYFQRSSVQEFMDFTSKILVERTSINTRSSVKQNDSEEVSTVETIQRAAGAQLCQRKEGLTLTTMRRPLRPQRKLYTDSMSYGLKVYYMLSKYLCHVYVRSDGIAGVLMADHEYPQRVAHTLLNKILDEFTLRYPKKSWTTAQISASDFPAIDEMLRKYQNPREADALAKVQGDLDETKIILHNTIEAVLQRGEKLDDLVEKSEGLSFQSKTFYKTAKKTNQCCVLL